jgi:hypothetical protein
MNRIVEMVRALLRKRQPVPTELIEDLCDEAEALQDVNDRLMKVGDYAPKHEED